MNPNTLFSIKNISCGYKIKNKSHQICFANSLEFKKGCFSAIIGSNGSGKSTFLKSLSRQLNLLDGEIYLDGKLLTEYSVSQLAKKIAIVLTDRPSTGYLCVYEVIALGRYPYRSFFGQLSNNDKIQIEKALYQTKLEKLAYQKASTLSDGEFRRLMTARAIAQESEIILLDEKK